jgi:hypothetical protein
MESEAMDKKELAKYGEQSSTVEPFDIDELDWKWFGTLTFVGSPSLNQAFEVYWRWFSELERAEGGPNTLNFVRIVECGPFPGGVRFHILMGGSDIGFKWDWMLQWVGLGGDDAVLSYYRHGFFGYVLKTAHEDSDLEITMDIEGCLWIF